MVYLTFTKNQLKMISARKYRIMGNFRARKLSHFVKVFSVKFGSFLPRKFSSSVFAHHTFLFLSPPPLLSLLFLLSSSSFLLPLFSPPPIQSSLLLLLPLVGLTPPELYLHLDVAVYYFFLQLYALFPCAFTTYLRGRYGPTGEVNEFQEYIAVSLADLFW